MHIKLKTYAYFLSENLKGRNDCGDMCIDEAIILNYRTSWSSG
jgi:hypothetical protein